jgi:hypothetical protein
MSRKPVSLEAALASSAPLAIPDRSEPRMQPERPAIEKATVYLPRAAMRRIKQMALDQDKRINDLLQEGIDMMLERYGQPSLKEYDGK